MMQIYIGFHEKSINVKKCKMSKFLTLFIIEIIVIDRKKIYNQY